MLVGVLNQPPGLGFYGCWFVEKNFKLLGVGLFDMEIWSWFWAQYSWAFYGTLQLSFLWNSTVGLLWNPRVGLLWNPRVGRLFDLELVLGTNIALSIWAFS